MKRKTAKDEKINIKGALKKYTDFEDKIQNSLDITLSGKDNFHMIALVNGVKKIEEYTEEKIVFSSGERKLYFLGQGLECANYASGAVEVFGKIDSVLFDRWKNNEN
jgi:hypothetical protein